MIKRRHVGSLRCLPWMAAWLSLVFPWLCCGTELEEGQRMFLAGQYQTLIPVAQKQLEDRSDNEEWSALLGQALLQTGQYPQARDVCTNALAHDPRSLRLRWIAREAFLSNGQTEQAGQLVDEIIQRASSQPWSYRDAPNLTVLGQALLLRALDPKRVLDTIFDGARKSDPKLRDLYLASGQLALDKHDYSLAAKKFEDGLKRLPDDPDLHYGLARAYAPSDQALMLASLDTTLEQNSNHVPALLLLVDYHIDAEEYSEAEKLLDRINTINPWHPEAWAYRSVLAHLQHDPAAEQSAREAGLKFWAENPRVDFLIGQKLSQNYRFAEGAAHQRQALKFDPEYLLAKGQLAQDLLRLGEENEGWKLAEEVQKQDGYDIQAFNLASLQDKMRNFAVLTNEDFLVRMESHEAAVYGRQVLDLLSQARSNLCAKYGQELKRPTIVEVFPDQKDFAVRTFGMPGNPGYLGVCFGRVVTANSPASQKSHPVNWKAVLWHEFCHVVTLQMTRNKMPRWLSEGISVYEEMQADPSWGQHMNPQYREMVQEELTPLSKLSAAFLSPRSEQHLQFAYFEASLAVDFLVQRFGLDQLKMVLRELGEGRPMNQTLESHTESLAKLDEEFAAFALERARKLAPGLDFEKPAFAEQKPGEDAPAGHRRRPSEHPPKISEGDWNTWSKDRPTNFWALVYRAQQAIEEKRWSEAKPPLLKLIELYPGLSGPDSAYRLLAIVHHQLGETNAEKEILTRFAEQDDEAIDAYARLMELNKASQEWPSVVLNARRYLAVNPLLASPYKFMGQAAEKIGDTPRAIEAYQAQLALDPSDPAQVHFHLAQLLRHSDPQAARRHVLQALEEAPRYPDALKLLLELNNASPHSQLAPAFRGVVVAQKEARP